MQNMPSDKTSDNKNAGDSAPAVTANVKVENSDSKGKAPPRRGGGGRSKDPTSSAPKSETSGSKTTPGFAEGNQILNSYGLSVSGYRERVFSPFKAEKYFHFVEQSYQKLAEVKPSITNRFSFAEFRHASALQLYSRLEQVKFDALGVKPSAPTRIPLPRNLRVFQPIWSVLSNIGIVDDDELRVTYVPEGLLPQTEDLTTPEDIENLVSCCLYDWPKSWENVKTARDKRKPFAYRDGFDDTVSSNEAPLSKTELMAQIQEKRAIRAATNAQLNRGEAKIIDGILYKFPKARDSDKKSFNFEASKHLRSGSMVLDVSVSDTELAQGPGFDTLEEIDEQIDDLMRSARSLKEKAITPRFDVSYHSSVYQVSDGMITAQPGAYGSWLRWDPQLWLDYENFVNELQQVCLFSLSMPNETTGTYAWLLPVEKRQGSESEVFAKMPKASIPPVTWVLALLLQSSMLPDRRRSTFYCETDVLGNVLGLRQRYINAAVKSAAPMEQYGTY